MKKYQWKLIRSVLVGTFLKTFQGKTDLKGDFFHQVWWKNCWNRGKYDKEHYQITVWDDVLCKC